MIDRVIARLGSAPLVMLGVCTVVFMLIHLVVNTLTDLAYLLLDPRIPLSCSQGSSNPPGAHLTRASVCAPDMPRSVA
jgi:hypothetical protein